VTFHTISSFTLPLFTASTRSACNCPAHEMGELPSGASQKGSVDQVPPRERPRDRGDLSVCGVLRPAKGGMA
jgi:hypothetical protein